MKLCDGIPQHRRAAVFLLPVVPLALKQVAPFHSRNDLLRRALIVGVVGVVQTGHGHAAGMMEVVVPAAVETEPVLDRRTQHARLLQFVLGGDDDFPLAGRLCGTAA